MPHIFSKTGHSSQIFLYIAKYCLKTPKNHMFSFEKGHNTIIFMYMPKIISDIPKSFFKNRYSSVISSPALQNLPAKFRNIPAEVIPMWVK